MAEMIDEEPGSMVDDLIDELIPGNLDWQRLVTTYPLPALAVVALGGFYLGLRHGTEILSALSGYAASEVSRNVSHLLDREG
ncbi:MAG TPA: hypothetical protein VF789_11520 [Thermoanaerobaculia bacterium]